MSELDRMAARLDPATWGWVKITFVVLGLITFIGIRLKHHKAAHIALELTAFTGLTGIFLFGVYTRGVLGTAASEPHGRAYFAVLIPHILCGMVYAVSSLCLMRLGYCILAKGQTGYIAQHRKLGKLAAFSLYVSIMLALPL